ncbi:LacI family DNA-binding transcriptional regulator [Halalkalibacter krulwichiae]|uniref:Ribose operon repressor n=1 Tax=Halalkalibacter krulwichiae TaxID=199441 RepID=A0A1X9MIC7_9BACI|nr:LacI family DNA-binding transcriptional regulator [Halalkalibacter krulwichiae]ARK32430.1 Ribose operon repressor [Halalkalibacter krulwichiae]
MTKKVTINDIAKAANTSTATVSRVLNNPDYPVKESLRTKVMEAIEQLNYVPNLVGKQLKTNTSNEIGVIIPNISNPYYTLLISGLEYVIRQSEKYILLCNTNGDPELERKYLEYLYQKQVRGMIISSINPDVEYLRFLQKNHVQIVAFEQDLDLDCTKINFDYYRGGFLAAEHLIKRGHRDIGFISAPLSRHSRRKVYEGFQACLNQYGIKEQKEYIKIGSDQQEISGEMFEYQNGKNLASQLLSEKKLPTSIFCINDMTAFGVIQQLQNNGLKIPEDVAVVGFDNIDMCEIVNPSLTTIDQSTFEMGRLAAEALMYSMKNTSAAPTNNLLQPTLIERQSTNG